MFQRQQTHEGRNQRNFVMQRPRKERGRNSIRYRGPPTWNLLSPEAKSCNNRANFQGNQKIVNWIILVIARKHQ